LFTTEETGESISTEVSNKIKKCEVLVKMKKKYVKTSDIMEGFCFVISVTCLSRPNTDDDDDDEEEEDDNEEFIFMK
jgi:hypothetical protein